MQVLEVKNPMFLLMEAGSPLQLGQMSNTIVQHIITVPMSDAPSQTTFYDQQVYPLKPLRVKV